MKKFWLSVLGLTILFAGLSFHPSFGQGPLQNAMNIPVRTTTGGDLMVFGVTVGAQGPLTNLANIRLRTYGGGDLGIAINGGTITPTTVTLTPATGKYGFASVSNAFQIGTGGYATCSSLAPADGGLYFSVCNAAVHVNAAALDFDVAGTTSNVIAATTTAKLTQVLDGAAATGLELNTGTPALGTCTGGTLVSGSHNFGGEITGNTSGSCVLNFGTPNFTNTPFCTLNDETNLVAARVSARSNASITITGLTSGDAVQYLCFGRIGT